MRAAPAPTPTVEFSPPTLMSTEGRMEEQVAREACTGWFRNSLISSVLTGACDSNGKQKECTIQLVK